MPKKVYARSRLRLLFVNRPFTIFVKNEYLRPTKEKLSLIACFLYIHMYISDNILIYSFLIRLNFLFFFIFCSVQIINIVIQYGYFYNRKKYNVKRCVLLLCYMMFFIFIRYTATENIKYIFLVHGYIDHKRNVIVIIASSSYTAVPILLIYCYSFTIDKIHLVEFFKGNDHHCHLAVVFRLQRWYHPLATCLVSTAYILVFTWNWWWWAWRPHYHIIIVMIIIIIRQSPHTYKYHLVYIIRWA